jgi:hypothetical protein
VQLPVLGQRHHHRAPVDHVLRVFVSVSAEVHAGGHAGERSARPEAQSAVGGDMFVEALIAEGLRRQTLIDRTDVRGQLLEFVFDGLLFGLDAQTKLAHEFGARELAPVVVHAPGASEGEAGAASLRIQTLTGAALQFVGAAPSLGGDPELGQLVGQEGVELVGVVLQHAVPHHDADHDEGRAAEVAGAVLHDDQVLLVDAGSPDYLREERSRWVVGTPEGLTHLAMGHPCDVLPSLPV